MIRRLSPTIRTSIIIGILSVIALYSFITHLDALSVALPLFLFYILFLINSFFSIRLFLGIIPHNIPSQIIDDLILLIIYIVMALNFHNPLFFSYLIALFFIFGTAKYVFLLPILKDQPRLLRRKIFANLLGILMGVVAVGLILLGYTLFAVWAVVIGFGMANIFIFYLTPLYRLD